MDSERYGLSDDELCKRGLPLRDEVAQLIQDKLGPDSAPADWLATAELALVELMRRASGDPQQQKSYAATAARHFIERSMVGLPKRNAG